MKKLRILIVEDETIIAWDLRRTIERLGSEVCSVAADADAAVACARADSPDLILMDIKLRGVRTGIDAALEIRRFSEVPLVYLTGNAHLANDPEIVATRAQGMYSKPPSQDQLIQMLAIARAPGPA
ncbi:MAG: response regulator [Spirochaetae bacterium HGW-Spirochaetae-7]|jgi:CheY-like chemotaxis protein|nr:MAG: response regulator [Spirochaetae bacterium HGW-Spirochaetae-7]